MHYATLLLKIIANANLGLFAITLQVRTVLFSSKSYCLDILVREEKAVWKDRVSCYDGSQLSSRLRLGSRITHMRSGDRPPGFGVYRAVNVQSLGSFRLQHSPFSTAKQHVGMRRIAQKTRSLPLSSRRTSTIVKRSYPAIKSLR